MANYTTSLKIQLLIQFIYDGNFPSKNKIISYFLAKDFDVSSRTLDRYFARIRADFGIEISYNSKKKGYFINEEESVKVASFFKYLEIIQVADIFSKSLKDSSKILDYISFDDSKNFKGIENLKDILVAIKQEREITFVHENYERKTKKEYAITPLILKEYLNRWYVVGAIDKVGETRTFGIDRIFDLKITKLSNINREKYNDKLERFKHTVGLTYGEGEPEKVSLLIDELHVKYLRSLPLHQSQIIHPKDKNNKHQVDFYIYPNYEFKTQILKIGAEAEVIAPQYLREQIIVMLKDSLKRYE